MISIQTSLIDSSLIPNESVIDERYRDKHDVEVQQSIISFWMQKTRQQNSRPQTLTIQPSSLPSHITNMSEKPSEIEEDEAFVSQSIYNKTQSVRNSKDPLPKQD